jgi:single-strand DNA-binding protein
MSQGLNKVVLLGSLGADPELRFTQGGQAVLNIRMATSESYLDKDKVRRERTDWHNIVVWGKRGEALAKILHKGSRILVEGSLRTSSYDDKNGERRYKTEVHAAEVILCGDSRGGDRDDSTQQPSTSGASGERRTQHGTRGGGGGSARGAAPAAASQADDWGGDGAGALGDDDVPFASSSMRHDMRRVGM